MGYNYKLPEEKFYLDTVMETIVTSIQDENGMPFFHKGYWRELATILKNLTGARFPLIYLPIEYKKNGSEDIARNDINFELWLINNSIKKLSTTQRTVNIQSILEPIYDDLITGMLDNKWFRNPERVLIPEKTLLPSLGAGTDNENLLSESSDAIYLSFNNTEIINLKNY